MINKHTIGRRKTHIKSEEIVDVDTGEIRIVKEFEHYDIDINWEKVWLENLLFAIGLVSEKATTVLCYFLDNRNYENKVYVNKKMIIDHTGISRNTVYRVISALINGNVIKEIDQGYQVNPDILFNTKAAKDKKIERLDVRISYYGFTPKDKKTFEFGG